MPNHELDSPPSLFAKSSIQRACGGESELMDFRSSAAELIRDKFHPACPASAITCVRQVLVLHIGKPV
jgi:hypothetical protein